MSVETRSTKPHLQLPGGTESAVLANVSGSLKTLGGRTVRWLLALGRSVSVRWFRNSSTGEPEPVLTTPARSSAAAKLYWADNSPSESVFLRSFDRFEEILHEALVLEIGRIAEEFPLRDKISHLIKIGFLTEADCNEWADCLAVRTSLLLADEGRRQPSTATVEDALGRMLKLQVVLTDRRRSLFVQESEIRQQEEATLREIAGVVD